LGEWEELYASQPVDVSDYKYGWIVGDSDDMEWYVLEAVKHGTK
jgi:hypothetical protein